MNACIQGMIEREVTYLSHLYFTGSEDEDEKPKGTNNNYGNTNGNNNGTNTGNDNNNKSEFPNWNLARNPFSSHEAPLPHPTESTIEVVQMALHVSVRILDL